MAETKQIRIEDLVRVPSDEDGNPNDVESIVDRLTTRAKTPDPRRAIRRAVDEIREARRTLNSLRKFARGWMYCAGDRDLLLEARIQKDAAELTRRNLRGILDELDYWFAPALLDESEPDAGSEETES